MPDKSEKLSARLDPAQKAVLERVYNRMKQEGWDVFEKLDWSLYREGRSLSSFIVACALLKAEELDEKGKKKTSHN